MLIKRKNHLSKAECPASGFANGVKIRSPLSKPTRPRTAYNYFVRDERLKILKEFEEKAKKDGIQMKSKRKKRKKILVSFEEIGKIIGKRWKDIDKISKDKYIAMANEDSKRYQVETKAYNDLRCAKITSRKSEELHNSGLGELNDQNIDFSSLNSLVVPSLSSTKRLSAQASQPHEDSTPLESLKLDLARNIALQSSVATNDMIFGVPFPQNPFDSSSTWPIQGLTRREQSCHLTYNNILWRSNEFVNCYFASPAEQEYARNNFESREILSRMLDSSYMPRQRSLHRYDALQKIQASLSQNQNLSLGQERYVRMFSGSRE